MNNKKMNESGEWVLVTDNAEYESLNEKWEELDSVTLNQGERLYHYSDCTLDELVSKKTCFLTSRNGNGSGHVYEFTAPYEMEAKMSPDGRKMRVELKEGMALQYLGYANY